MTLKEKLFGAMVGNRVGHALIAANRDFHAPRSNERQLNHEYSFTDRSTGSDKLCVILAGYKPELWDVVFGRIAAFIPQGIDVCIMTSGLVNERLQAIAQEHGWSYLSTSDNHLCLVQNIAIDCHPHAQWIYKLDEDMFVTKGFFEKMLETYEHVQNETMYEPAFVAPLINVNCYGHLRLLDKCGLLDDFRATGLTNMKLTDGLHHSVEVLKDPRVARYLWGETQPVLADIDALTERFSAEPLSFSICPTRFSIGAILFTRAAWEEFGHFPLTFVGGPYGLGDDEEHICHYATFTGRVMVVNENVVVGHLGYGGPQTAEMTQYFMDHTAQFELPTEH
ncbi:MAG: hypothetical protein Q4G41_04295 [Coriobacteriales bacterium]|nr:hypothetical protein [Coriobacteriales bacterium]